MRPWTEPDTGVWDLNGDYVVGQDRQAAIGASTADTDFFEMLERTDRAPFPIQVRIAETAKILVEKRDRETPRAAVTTLVRCPNPKKPGDPIADVTKKAKDLFHVSSLSRRLYLLPYKVQN